MAKKKKSLFECQACGYQSSKWLGKCPNCGAWDEFVEVKESDLKPLSLASKREVKPITKIEEEKIERFSTFDRELDLVLGGGVVPGSLVLIGGSPGVGKSTLLLKIGGNLAKAGKKVLYVSGEESMGQIKIRANRLKANEENLFLMTEIRLQSVLEELRENRYDVLIVDSIQTLYSENLTSAPGSVSQVREITFSLCVTAKRVKRLFLS